jgi:hypothetical protein
MERVCVLFAGNAGHGKDTAANMLADVCRERDVSPLRMAFADPIKDIAVHLLGIPKEISYGTQQDKLDHHVYGKSARHWLQWIGTEMGRDQIHQDIWVHRFAEKALASDARVVIGSDCRFQNEMVLMHELLRDKMGLHIVRIVNPRVPVNLNHQSESEVHGMDDSVFDHVIRNTKGLSDLMGDVEDFAERVFG